MIAVSFRRIVLIAFVIIITVFFVVRKKQFFVSPQLSSNNEQRVIPIALPVFSKPSEMTWNVQSIDTMKYSRDLARGKLKNLAFLEVIDNQIKNIAETGANYVAIDTPYDQEFFPMLSIWVATARKYGMHVWFRGNWSGWENWFGYPKINREQHIKKTNEFILNHPDIFKDGDIFSACPECENGGSGDPRQTGDVDGFRNFIISEYKSNREAFSKIEKKVFSNYYPMNKDVAQLIMDKDTTEALDSIVVVDHYVSSPDKLASDIKYIQEKTGGKVMLGEFGAPLPEINGKMTEKQQAQWIDDVLKKINDIDGVEGVNYWLNTGGSTGIWDKNGKALSAVSVLKKYFKTRTVFGIVTDELNKPIRDASISFLDRKVFSSEDGYFEIKFIDSLPFKAIVSATGFINKEVEINNNNIQLHLTLNKK